MRPKRPGLRGEVVTLQSSTMGLGVYQRMGFQQVSTYRLHLKEPGDGGGGEAPS